MFYTETNSADPCFNLAFEEYLLTNKKDGDLLMLWQNASTVVIGMNQNAEAEINREYVETHNVTVVRRKTGGGAVYHDMGNLNYSFISDAGPLEELDFGRFALPVCRALAALGVPAESTGRNDILVDGKKVSGVAQRVLNGRVLHHGTLLFDSDPEAIAGALKADPGKFKSKSTKSVKSRVGNLKDYLPGIESIEDFKNAILEELSKGEVLIRYSPTEAELKTIEEISKQYRSREWTYGRSPEFEYNNKMRFEKGSLAVSADIRKGNISGIMFTGDFMAKADLTDIEAALTGSRYDKAAVKDILQNFDLDSCFGGLTADEITEVLFNG